MATVAITIVTFFINNALTEYNTTVLSATVDLKQASINEKKDMDMIYTKEYGDRLHVAESIYLDYEELLNLESGQTIYFRIENMWLDLLEDIPYIRAVSLWTDQQEILSLKDYNKTLKSNMIRVRFIAVFFSLFFFSIVIICIIGLAKISKRKRTSVNKTPLI